MRNSSDPLTGRAFSEAFVNEYPSIRPLIDLFQQLPLVLFYAKDARQRYIAVNPRTLMDVFGLTDVEQLYGRTDSEFQPPALADAYHAEDRRVMEHKRTISQSSLVGAARSWYAAVVRFHQDTFILGGKSGHRNRRRDVPDRDAGGRRVLLQ